MECKHGVGVALYGGDQWCEHCGAVRMSGSAEWVVPRPAAPQGPDPDEQTVQLRERAGAKLEQLASRIRSGEYVSAVMILGGPMVTTLVVGEIDAQMCIALQGASRRATRRILDGWESSLDASIAEAEAHGTR